MVITAIYNVNNDYEKNPEGFSPMDFMPGAKSADDDMREFVEAVERGDKFETSAEEIAAFRSGIESTFRNVKRDYRD